MQNFFANVLIKVLSDTTVQAAIEKLIGNIIAKQIVPLVPVAVGAAVKTAVDDVIRSTPGLSGVVDVVKTTEGAMASLTNLIPGIPVLGDLLKFWGIKLP